MWDALRTIFDLHDLLNNYGMDVAVYLFMGVIGFVLLVIRLGITLMFGDFDADVDLDVDGAIDLAHDADFSLFSVLSVLAFFTAIGWTGVLCRVDLGLSAVPSATIATSVGVVFMFLAAGMMFYIRRLNRTVTYKPLDAVGKTATVYLSIPKRGEGAGQVNVTVSGRRMVMAAISTGEPIKAFTEVVVKEARDDETLVVEPKYAAKGEAV